MQPKNVYITGDLHQSYFSIENFYNEHKDELYQKPENNIMILLGDVCANFFLNKRDEEFKEKLISFPFTYFCIRGNHEERPSFLASKYLSDWHQEMRFGNLVWIENRFPSILYALDEGGEYDIEGKSILVIPGAYSVDKWYRLMNRLPWFPEEQLSEEEQERLLNEVKPQYDYVLSHTCPCSWQYQIKDLFLPQIDQSTVDCGTEKFLDAVAAKTQYKHWYFGHYHRDRDLKPENATMLFHQIIPFGMTLSDYWKYCLTF